jgi:hypothetical protein
MVIEMDKFREIADRLLHDTIQQMFAQGGINGNQNDVDILVQLCMMVMKPLGNENPHDLIRGMSDDVINQIIDKKSQLANNTMVDSICQLCETERLYRDGKLDEDWIWKWDDMVSGHMAYKLKEPVASITGTYHIGESVMVDIADETKEES